MRDGDNYKVVEEYKMYILYRNETPIAYRYGPPWVAQMLLMEGGYDTPDEAKEAWFEYLANSK